MSFEGKIENGAVVVPEPLPLPDGTAVTIAVAIPSKKLGQRLLRHAGTVEGLPEDLAEQHDHYLHGTPKR